MHHLYLSARHTVHYLPAWHPLILKGCPFGSLLSRRVEPLDRSGLSADSDSPLAPSAQHGSRAKPVNKVQLSGKWCSVATPSHISCLQGCGQASLLPGLTAPVRVFAY